MQIGELAKRSGFSRDTLRYYEKLGLLPPEQFQLNAAKQNNYRDYKDSALTRLQHIQQLKDIGFTLQEIQLFLGDLDSSDPCKNLPSVFLDKIQRVDEKIALLQRFRNNLEASLTVCTSRCGSELGRNNSSTEMPSCISNGVQTYSPEI